MATKQRPLRPLIGWREWITLSQLSPVPMKAKIDTGARTSSLHAFRLRNEMRDGKLWVSFFVHPHQRSRKDATLVEMSVNSFKKVKSSNGATQMRPTIKTPITIGDKTFLIEVTLTSRDEMGFRMLLARNALSRRYLIDPGGSYLHGHPNDRT